MTVLANGTVGEYQWWRVAHIDVGKVGGKWQGWRKAHIDVGEATRLPLANGAVAKCLGIGGE